MVCPTLIDWKLIDGYQNSRAPEISGEIHYSQLFIFALPDHQAVFQRSIPIESFARESPRFEPQREPSLSQNGWLATKPSENHSLKTSTICPD